MSNRAQQRIAALGQQLSPNSSSSSSSSSTIPPVEKIAPGSSKPRVQGKVVIITGANSVRGIGRATAHQYAENGARAVYICDFDSSNFEAHKEEFQALYPAVDVHLWQFDATSEDKVKAVVDDAMKRYGRLDVFFANAALTGKNLPFHMTKGEDFMDVLRINVLSVFLAVKHAAPAMMKTSASKPQPAGSLIVTSSVAGIRANAGSVEYSASKAAVRSMAQTVAYELAGTGLRINAICPGIIQTAMTAPIFDKARANGTDKKIGQVNPLKRPGQADEIARVALFLGSDESSYVNGQAWVVDGGLSASHPYTTFNKPAPKLD